MELLACALINPPPFSSVKYLLHMLLMLYEKKIEFFTIYKIYNLYAIYNYYILH